ncbi:hypothetical protein [Autumnicola edwardsiae]|uniref:Uncharacterized protein n=1 Tax=Autumnicola edwardsiae TaxID=3075594 RepID=A0ABU3D030_9FLAO|nr:hypothetical protein [Zunongwangia sp. F297]MDT0651980.1 hypothetical protein [Zunongwangia sp. F297]
MSRIQEKLSLMTDKELAILIKYKIGEYLKPTQEEILSYSKERKMTAERITQLTSDYNGAHSKRKPSTALEKVKNYVNEVIAGILGSL